MLGGSITSLLPIKCLLNSQSYGPFFLNMFMPWILLTISGMFVLLRIVIERKLRSGRQEAVPPVFKGKFNLPRVCARWKPVRLPMTDEDIRAWRAPFRPMSRLAGISVFIFFSLYPTLVSSIVSIFNCTEFIHEKRYLLADLTVVCFEGGHIAVFIVACFFAGLYAGGIPIAVAVASALKTPIVCRGVPDAVTGERAWAIPHCVCQRRTHEKYATMDVRTRFGFLFAGYHTDRSGFIVAWEAWVMFRKLAVSLAGSAVSDPYLQILAALLILVISALATAFFQPYEIMMLNMLDIAGQFALIVTQVLSIVYFYVETAERPFMNPKVLESLTTVILFLLNAIALLCFLVAFGVEMLSVRDKWMKRNSRVVKVITDQVVIDQALLAGQQTADGFWWHHPSDVAVRTSPEKVLHADGTPSNDWNWHDDDAGIGISSETPELLQEVDSVEVLETNDNYRWMDKTSHELSLMAKQFADVGGRACCTEEGRRFVDRLRQMVSRPQQPVANFDPRDPTRVVVMNPVRGGLPHDTPDPPPDRPQPDLNLVQRVGRKAHQKLNIALARQAARRGGDDENMIEMGRGRRMVHQVDRSAEGGGAGGAEALGGVVHGSHPFLASPELEETLAGQSIQMTVRRPAAAATRSVAL